MQGISPQHTSKPMPLCKASEHKEEINKENVYIPLCQKYK
jgi:hypothetical protein